jgi:hypothetical protein
MRLRKAVESLWEISPLPVPSATAKTPGKALSGLVNTGFVERLILPVPCSRFVTYGRQKMTGADSVNHRQIRAEVYTHPSGSNLRFKSTKEIANGPSGTSR